MRAGAGLVPARSLLRACALAAAVGWAAPGLAAPPPGYVGGVDFSSRATSDWRGRWVWRTEDGLENSWTAFRKTFTAPASIAGAAAHIAVDSKYWLWVNGVLVVYEGGLKRGPDRTGTWYDEVDVGAYLQSGASNTVAVLVWHFGRNGYSHSDSGKGGLLFDLVMTNDAGVKTRVSTDRTWRMKALSAYSSRNPAPNGRLPERSVKYDARNAPSSTGQNCWTLPGFNDSAWAAAVDKGAPGVAPWNGLVKRPIPQWRISPVKDFERGVRRCTGGNCRINNNSVAQSLPYTNGTSGDVFLIGVPHRNVMMHPVLTLGSGTTAGVSLAFEAENQNLEYTVSGEYVAKAGAQTYEHLPWIHGEHMVLQVPAGATVDSFRYRQTGYDVDVRGSFDSNDDFQDKMWKLAEASLHVNMRDIFMDTPGRERAQWWGDVVVQSGQLYHSYDARGHLLMRKGIRDLVNWRKPAGWGGAAGGELYSPVPAGIKASCGNDINEAGGGVWCAELPLQMLASVGHYGFWRYYVNTADRPTIDHVYAPVRDYLSKWEWYTETAGDDAKYRDLVKHRYIGPGIWAWTDWQANSAQGTDNRILSSAWYYLALRSALAMAELKDVRADAADFRGKMKRIRDAFHKPFWRSEGYYRDLFHVADSSLEQPLDDRANGLAVVAGLVDRFRHPQVAEVLKIGGRHYTAHASPYMENFVVEALARMGHPDEALARVKKRWSPYAGDSSNHAWRTTLPEHWFWLGVLSGSHTHNHAWSGGMQTLLTGTVAGLGPDEPAWEAYHVLPDEGSLTDITAVVPTGYGDIRAVVDDNGAASTPNYTLTVTAPPGARPTLGIPLEAFDTHAVGAVSLSATAGASTVKAATTVWSGGAYVAASADDLLHGTPHVAGRHVRFPLKAPARRTTYVLRAARGDQVWTRCAWERGTCSAPASAMRWRFGAAGRYAQGVSSTSFTCTAAALTDGHDPASGVAKRCDRAVPSAPNASLAATATTASGSHAGSGWSLAAAFDGQQHSRGASMGWSSSAAAAAATPTWIALDLGGAKAFGEVRLHPAGEAGGFGAGFPVDFEVQVSNDGNAWTTVSRQRSFPRPTREGAVRLPFANVTRRHVRVRATKLRKLVADGAHYMRFAEVEVSARGDANGEAQWSHCAAERGTCSFTGPASVRYGANEKYRVRDHIGGAHSIACTSAGFGGDPISGVPKSCRVARGASWTSCAAENQPCKHEGHRMVRFGEGAGTTFARIALHGVDCASAAFGGDPRPGVAKTCSVLR